MTSRDFAATIAEITAGLSLEGAIQAAQDFTPVSVDQARQIYQIWSTMNAAHPLVCIAHFNCSTLLDQAGDIVSAEIELRRAIAANPDFAPARINLGGILERRGQAGSAVQEWNAGLERMGAITRDAIDYKVTYLKQISRVLSDNHDLPSAEVVLSQCLDLAPDQRDISEQYVAARLAQCIWPPLSGSSRVSRETFLKRLHPLSMCAYTDDPLLQLASADQYVRTLAPITDRTTAFDRRDAGIPPGRKLRIGYVSSDLRHHAVGYLIAEVFDLHDRDAFDIFAYYSGPEAHDPIAQRIRAATNWTNIRGMSDDEAAAKIRDDGIDILIDVNGHTRDARLGIFARRPAPVQVNWLGYPGTMGSSFHHYIVADANVIPPESERFYSEAVLRLPCYQPNDRKRLVSSEIPTRAAMGLPEDAFVFCSFNASHKITRFSFERWLTMLNGAPDSVLWLLDYGEKTNARLRSYAAERGVAAERLIFAPKMANTLHLARYPLADLVIDTAPYGAHTTASDALWMGVPVLTFAGECFAARVCASLVRSAGLPELVCETPDAFVAQGIALATTDRARLAGYRARLIATRDDTTLFDTPLLVRSMEDLYRQMAENHRNGLTPTPKLGGLDVMLDIGVKMDHDAEEIGYAPDYLDRYAQALAHREIVAAAPPIDVFPTETPQPSPARRAA